MGGVTNHYGGFAADYHFAKGKRIESITALQQNPDVDLIIDYEGNRSWRPGRTGKLGGGWNPYPGGAYGHIHFEVKGASSAAKEFRSGRSSSSTKTKSKSKSAQV